jgi:hypothetical protein
MFGTGLAMGVLNGDGRDDLAIGVIGEDLGTPQDGVGDAGRWRSCTARRTA